MTTPWGEIPVSDAHIHFLGRSFFQILASQKKETRPLDEMVRGLGWQPPPDNTALADVWAEELDRNGVDRGVLIASLPGEEEAVAEALRAHPGRFWGYFIFNPLEPEAEQRARRAFDELGMQGLCLFPAMHRFSIRDERLDPLWRLVAERPGRVAFVHMGVLTVGVRKKLGLASPFDVSLSNPLDLHGVAAKHPETTFVLPHFGAGFLREALMLADLAPNVYFDTSSSNSWTKYQLPEISLKAVFGKALDLIGPRRLLFGSDSSFFPRGWNREVFDTQAALLEELGVGEEAARAIFGGNLERLLSP